MKNIRQNKLGKGGFTLIEVVLVLAIGGLIFLLAFIAFQQVSTNRRDTQRRNDTGRIVAELQNASGDGFKVTSPATLTSFQGTYLGAGLEAPSGSYSFNYVTNNATAPANQALPATPTGPNNIFVSYNSSCPDGVNNAFAKTAGAYAVIMNLEKGSVCRDDQ